MSQEEIKAQIRKRVNITQTAKGLHQVEVTQELITGVDEQWNAEQIAQSTLRLIQEIEKALTADGRKLVTSEVAKN